MQAKFWRAVVVVLAVALGGCGPKVADAPAKKEHAEALVKVWCADAGHAAVFGPRAQAWAYRNSAKLEIASREDDADVLLVPTARLGRYDPPASLRTVPTAVAGEASGFQWGGLLGVYQNRLAHWGGDRYAVPLVGEAFVLVYRADVLGETAFSDAFRQKHQRVPLPIRSWDELADVGQFATARSGKPGLPPLPSDPVAAVATFGQIAACYDRVAATGGGTQVDPAAQDPYFRGLSFYTDADVLRDRSGERWEVRIGEPAFGEAFRWFEATAKCRPAQTGNVLDSLVSGSAVAAVLPIGDLTKLPRNPTTGAVDAKFGVAAVPGSSAYFNAKRERVRVAGVNRVPVYTGGGLIGVVRQSAKHPDAAWALLAELGGPAGSSASLDTPAVGGGPLRIEHAAESTAHWQQYGFDPAGTADLGIAVREFVSPGTINPAIALRTPDVDDINALLARSLAGVASGELSADAGQKQAEADWRALDAKTPKDARLTHRRKSAGLD